MAIATAVNYIKLSRTHILVPITIGADTDNGVQSKIIIVSYNSTNNVSTVLKYLLLVTRDQSCQMIHFKTTNYCGNLHAFILIATLWLISS